MNVYLSGLVLRSMSSVDTDRGKTKIEIKQTKDSYFPYSAVFTFQISTIEHDWIINLFVWIACLSGLVLRSVSSVDKNKTKTEIKQSKVLLPS